MTISASNVRFDADTIWVSLKDGRTIGVPLVWFPKLVKATEEELQAVEISPYGLHWEALDEDVSVPALLSDVPRVAAE